MSRKNDLLVLSEQYAKVYENTNNVPEGDASAVNMGPNGVLEIQPDGQHPEAPAKGENAEGIDDQEKDPLEDPRFQDVIETLEDLRTSYPNDFEKFVIRLMDIVGK